MRIELRGLHTVGRIVGVLDEERLLAVAQIVIVLCVVDVPHFSAVERMALEQESVDENSQGVAVGGDLRQVLLRVLERKGTCGHDFGGDETGRAHHFGRKLLRHDQTVAIDDAGIAGERIDQNIVVRQIGVRQPRGMEAADGTCDFQAHV